MALLRNWKRLVLISILLAALANQVYRPAKAWIEYQRSAYWWSPTPILCGDGTVYSATVRTAEEGSFTCSGDSGGATLRVEGKEYLIKLEPQSSRFQYGYSTGLTCHGQWQKQELDIVGYAPYSGSSEMQCTAWGLAMRADYMHR